MQIRKVTDDAFRKYGRIVEGYDFTEISQQLMKTPCPADSTVYVPSDAALEACGVYGELTERMYGGLPIQIGYCNGNNKALNALEYHRSSEINLPVGNGMTLLLGKREDVEADDTYDTAKVEAFYVPEGVAIEVFATTLHYAPCTSEEGGFRCLVVLPKDTNTELEAGPYTKGEERLMTAKNKWLIAHPDAGIKGAFCGLKGENITLE
jgi:hypothetical protein